MITLQELEDRIDEWNVQACVAVSAKDPNFKEFCAENAITGSYKTKSINSVRLAFTKAIAAALQNDSEGKQEDEPE